MIRIPYETIIQKIKEQANLSEDEINSRVKAKTEQLAGLISKEGAAHIISNELGVKLFEEGKLKINQIFAGMRSVETAGKILNIFETRDFQRSDGSGGKVASFVMADDTASIRVVLWNEQAGIMKDLEIGKVLNIKNAFAKSNNNGIELHISGKSEILINPPGENFEAVSIRQQQTQRKKIAELSEADNNTELLASVVQIFEPRFFEVCPECNKRMKQKDNFLVCEQHGKVAPSFSYVLNLILDDGTSTIRTVFFKNQLLNLLRMSHDEIIKIKDSLGDFQPLKDALNGSLVKVLGRVSKNSLFGRLEFIAQRVEPEPSPDEELLRLQQESNIVQ